MSVLSYSDLQCPRASNLEIPNLFQQKRDWKRKLHIYNLIVKHTHAVTTSVSLAS